MKILFLSDVNSAHTQKWAVALSLKGYKIAIFTFTVPRTDWHSEFGIQVFGSVNHNGPANAIITKLSYLALLPKVKDAIKKFQPQILHAHYASSYGLIGALSGFHPFIISAWGSDVMEFPSKSILHKAIVKYNFKNADSIAATSEILRKEISNLTDKPVFKIPFGIDTNYFRPLENSKTFFPDNSIVIGTVKSLELIYGIDILINSFKQLVDKGISNIKLLLVGGGSKENEYKELVKQMGLSGSVVFTGKVKYEEVVKYHNMIDIFVNVSRNESFGVAVLEASSCENAVIASKVGGLVEVVQDGKTGILIEPENISELSETLERLILNEELRIKMGREGRKFVQANYEFQKNLEDTCSLYQGLINNNG